MRRGALRSPWQPVAAATSARFLVAAALCLIVHQDPANWTTATENGSSSNVLTATESALAFLCVVGATISGILAPPDRDSSA